MFQNARLKLTLWYVLVLSFICISFSAVIYDLMSSEVDRFAQAQQYRLERQLREGNLVPFSYQVPVMTPLFDTEVIKEVKKRLLVTIMFINTGIILFSTGFAYLLAGRTLRPIQLMVQEQNRFISDASHELKTPLTSLKSAFEVFLRDKNPSLPEARVLISESVDEVNKLQSLSESLLQLAQYQIPQNRTKFSTVELSKVIREVVKTLQPQADKKQIQLEITTQDVKVQGNIYSLQEVITILLDNAIKYSHEKGQVSINLAKNRQNAIITITDEGSGISKKDLPHIFDRFFRADEARSRVQVGGYGLGLSIAKKIVEAHQGYINVSSKVKQGTTFQVHLPLRIME